MIKRFIYFYYFHFISASGLPAYEPCAGGTQENQERVLDHLELQPWTVMSSRVGAGTRT